jgi:hypothetical protein
MYFNDHPPPHFHVSSGSSRAMVLIETGEVYVGRLLKSAKALVKEWAEISRDLLYENWRRCHDGPELLKIGALP